MRVVRGYFLERMLNCNFQTVQELDTQKIPEVDPGVGSVFLNCIKDRFLGSRGHRRGGSSHSAALAAINLLPVRAHRRTSPSTSPQTSY